MNITHRGQALNQTQLDALGPFLNDVMHGATHKDFCGAVDAVLEAAGCPMPTRASIDTPASH